MIDQIRLERVLASWRKADPNSFKEFFEIMLKTFETVQSGLITSNDFNQIKFLQGIGTITSIFLSISERLLKTDNLIE